MISLLEIANSIGEAKMKLKPKDGGKIVTFTDKDNYEDALKSGDYEEPEGSKKVKSKGSDIDFDRAADDDADDMDRDARFDADAEDGEPKGEPKTKNKFGVSDDQYIGQTDGPFNQQDVTVKQALAYDGDNSTMNFYKRKAQGLMDDGDFEAYGIDPNHPKGGSPNAKAAEPKDEPSDDENEFSGPNPDDSENLEDAEETVTYYEDELNHHQERLQAAQDVLDDALRDPENAKDDIKRAKEAIAKHKQGIKINTSKLKDANEKVKSFGDDEPKGDEEPKDEPKRKLTKKGKEIQKAKEEFEDDAKYIDDPTEFDDWIDGPNGDYLDINEKEVSYSNDFGGNQIVLALEKYRDLWNDDDPDEEDAKDKLVNLITKRLDTMVDTHRETPTVKAKPKSKQTAADSREARNRVIKRIGRQAFDKLSYGEMEAEYEKELKAMGKRESIKVIDGKKYKAIKESKKNPRILKEIYDRTFRSLKWNN